MSSLAKLAIKRFNIGEKGGSCPKAISDRSRTVGVLTSGVLEEAVTLGLSSAGPKRMSASALLYSGTIGRYWVTWKLWEADAAV
jgi:hypothetical protein